MSGLQITVPEQTSLDAILSYFNSMATMPAWILILLAMGTIAGERERGTLVFLLTKPVTRTGVILTKFLTYFGVTAVATIIAAAAVGYYTVILFDANYQVGPYILLNLEMLSFLALMLAVIIFFSSLFKSGIAAGGMSLLASIILTMVVLLIPGYDDYLPQGAFDATFGRMVMTGKEPLSSLVVPTIMGFVIAGVVLAVSCLIAERREM
jgi:ABC-2 type transport system permease protein